MEQDMKKQILNFCTLPKIENLFFSYHIMSYHVIPYQKLYFDMDASRALWNSLALRLCSDKVEANLCVPSSAALAQK